MGHAGEIGEDGFAANVLAKGKGQVLAGFFKGFGGQHFAEVNRLAFAVGKLDADDVAALDNGHAGRHGAHRAGDIIGKADHARGFDPGGGLQFIQRDNRARLHVDDLAAHAEILQHAFEHAGVLLKHLVGKIDRLLGAALGFGQQGEGRKFKLGGFGKAQIELGILLDFFAQLDFLGFARHPHGRGFGNVIRLVLLILGGFIFLQFLFQFRQGETGFLRVAVPAQ